ncbi:2'-5' RNA ligase family protein [Rhizobium sp. Leaf341]|uniref:2'-5' RNA ligase family protein n=1 Tax=Rhizobium sp. Leaf341 TaxID=1736344 RepID=UPI0007156A0E|nr:2'-5' RNA ligase family protein [Rhizobium sp. Leaf341]KQR77973.1 hypothetical protein ASG03_16650 [Rhizobium sp. Leaf341]
MTEIGTLTDNPDTQDDKAFLPAHRPLILTAEMEEAAQVRFDRLRRLHFPSERNWLSAHLTLFHALPGEERVTIEQHLTELTAGVGPITTSVEGVRFLGNGVAFALSSGALQDLRAAFAHRWRDWLTRQDQQGFRPHVTVQNKVSPETARALQARLSEDFAPWDFAVTGLRLWHYDGGPWEPAAHVSFS